MFLFIVFVGYYIYILIEGPALPSVSYGQDGFFIPNKHDLFFHVISQKIVVYGLSFSILCQILFLKKMKYLDLID